MLTVEFEPADAIKAYNYIKSKATDRVTVELIRGKKEGVRDEIVIKNREHSSAIVISDRGENNNVDISITPYNYLIVTSYGFQSGIDI